MPADELYSQGAYSCRFAWGRRGALEAGARGDIVVIVDVLSFSTCVVTAAQHGGRIIPCIDDDHALRSAAELGAIAATARDAVPKRGRYSLSPQTYIGLKSGTLIALGSRNGGTCCRNAASGAIVLAGALINANITAWAVERARSRTRKPVTVIACGEQWEEPGEEGSLRVSIEDYLGAGAILSAISLDKSPEAWICAGAFGNARHRLAQALWECGSGLELRERGHGADVRHAAQLNLYSTVPILRGGSFIAAKDEDDLDRKT